MGGDFIANGGSVTLEPGDSLSLTYSPSPSPLDSTAGGWFAGAARTGTSFSSARPQRPSLNSLPVRFALHQNRPNPFSRTTEIRFDLPMGAVVKLEIFDAQGRRVETLADRFFPAGYQSVTWDPRRSGNVGPGVYFYRIQAGTFRDRKKLVLVGD